MTNLLGTMRTKFYQHRSLFVEEITTAFIQRARRAPTLRGPLNMDFDNLRPISAAFRNMKCLTDWELATQSQIRCPLPIPDTPIPWGLHQPGGPGPHAR